MTLKEKEIPTKLLFVLLLLLAGTKGMAQDDNAPAAAHTHTDGVIKGKVVDINGEPLPGVYIALLGSKYVTVSTTQGDFSLGVSVSGNTNDLVLQASFVGMEKQQIKVSLKDKKPIVIVMKEDVTTMKELTVVSDGYMKLPRTDMVGAYTTIKAEDVMMPAMISIDQMLQGKIAGMVVTNPSARIGAKPDIKIRGTATFLGNTAPLWVVDGIIQDDPLPIDGSSAITNNMADLIGNQVSWLNPQDIETITVLKDASATAIYGSKASNGVIVITTKKGSAERTSVSYSANVSVRERADYSMFDLMNSRERIQFSKEAYDAGARYQTTPLPQIYTYEGLMAMFNARMISESQFAKQMQFLETNNTDWLKLLTRNSVSQTHNVSLSGGTQKVTYNASLGFVKGRGTEIGDEKDQLTARLSVSSQMTKKLTLNFTLSGSYSNSSGYGSGVNPQQYALNTARSVPAYDQQGAPVFYENYYSYRYNSRDVGTLRSAFNIFNEMENSHSKNKAKTIHLSTNISYKFTDYLRAEMVVGLSYSGNASESYNGEKTSTVEQLYRGYPSGSEKYGSEKYKAAMLPFGGILSTYNYNTYGYDLQGKVNFSKTFNEIHRVNAMVALQARSTLSESEYNTVYGYVPERGDIIVFPNAPGSIVPIGSSQIVEWGALESLYNANAWRKRSITTNYFSVFGIAAYSLMNRYVFNVNMRSDASNRFGQDTNHRFNPTYSMGFSWHVAEENFVKEYLSWLNQFNLRCTYGVQGNVVNSVSPDLILTYRGLLSNYGEYYNNISSLPNPWLKWESTKSWNFGVDMQLFKGIHMSFEYYGRSSNAILNQEVAQEYGMTRMRVMGGRIKNHGVELTANFTPYRRKDFVWTIGFNMSKNWNENASNDQVRNQANKNSKSAYLSGSNSTPLKKGYPVDAFWSYKFAGLDHNTGYPNFNLNPHSLPASEIATDNNIDPTKFLIYSGVSNPYFTSGINTRIRWKDLSVGMDFSMLLGASKRLPNPYSAFSNGKIPSPFSNLSKMLNDRWKKPGDEAHTFIPSLYTSVLDEYNLTLPDGTISNSRYGMWANSDVMVADASFFRCSQISVTYYLPKRWLDKLKVGLQQVTVNATVNNIFVIASKRWRGFDPEFGGSSVMPRMYNIGVSVNF